MAANRKQNTSSGDIVVDKKTTSENKTLVYGSFNDFDTRFLPIDTAKYYAKLHSAHSAGISFEELYEQLPEFFETIMEYLCYTQYGFSIPSLKKESCQEFYINLFKLLYAELGNDPGWIGLSEVERPLRSLVDFTNYYQNELAFNERLPLANDRFSRENVDFYDLLEILNFGPRMDWAPDVILKKLGHNYNSLHDGPFTAFLIESQAEVCQAFENMGYTCVRDEKLIAQAYGQY